MLKYISNHKMFFIFLIFAILFLPITYSEAVHDGVDGYERIILCIFSILSSITIGCLCDIALKKEGTTDGK